MLDGKAWGAWNGTIATLWNGQGVVNVLPAPTTKCHILNDMLFLPVLLDCLPGHRRSSLMQCNTFVLLDDIDSDQSLAEERQNRACAAGAR